MLISFSFTSHCLGGNDGKIHLAENIDVMFDACDQHLTSISSSKHVFMSATNSKSEICFVLNAVSSFVTGVQSLGGALQ